MASIWHFERRTQGVFETLEDGTRVYFPHYVFSQGYIVESSQQECRLLELRARFSRRALRWIIAGLAALMAAVIVSQKYQFAIEAYIVGLFGLIMASYALAERKFILQATRGMTKTQNRPGVTRRLELRSRLIPWFQIILLPPSGICFLGLGLYSLVRSGGNPGGLALAVVGVLAILAGVLGFVLKHRDEARSHTRHSGQR